MITDTASGIAQIFTGVSSKESRIFTSTMGEYKIDRYCPLSVKNESPEDFRKIADLSSNSFTVDVASSGKAMEVLYCSKYDFRNPSGFSKLVFDGAEVISVVPWERAFSVLFQRITKIDSGTEVVYITSIDHSGHTMGSFSQFERYEHEKLNALFKNFLIELARDHSELFDGDTNIIITADHGMTESYRINITNRDIYDSLANTKNRIGKVIEANRAALLYDVSGQIDEVKQQIETYFKNKHIDIKALSKGDPLFESFIPDYNSSYKNTIPDIILLLVSEGIFHSKEVQEELMHFGGHGGNSCDEVFVPNIVIDLNEHLLAEIEDRFLKLE